MTISLELADVSNLEFPATVPVLRAWYGKEAPPVSRPLVAPGCAHPLAIASRGSRRAARVTRPVRETVGASKLCEDANNVSHGDGPTTAHTGHLG